MPDFFHLWIIEISLNDFEFSVEILSRCLCLVAEKWCWVGVKGGKNKKCSGEKNEERD